MFGIEVKINQPSLYMLNDIVEKQVAKNKKELSQLLELPDKNPERKNFLILQTVYFEQELKKFKEEVNKQLSENFQFSVEELYSMYGQFDNKHIEIEFHKFSESAELFGRNISGVIAYYKKEREQLYTGISAGASRNNGMVKFDSSSVVALSDEKKADLVTNGFKSGDVYQILSVDMPADKTYNKIGIKEIPNTINVNFDPKGFDPNSAYHWMYRQRLKNGWMLIEDEWARFCGLSLYLDPKSNQSDLILNHGYDLQGKIKNQVRFHELSAKFQALDINGEELFEFNDLLKERKTERINSIKLEIKRSTNKKLEQFENDYPDIYKELKKSIVEFETESIEYFDMVTPIYWDYASYLHIFLRHCNDLAIEGHFDNKTKFQYKQEDIRRVLNIAVRRLKNSINNKLKEGKEFRISGDRSLYFNGNYYALHVLPDGRIAAFNPIENPDN